MAETGEDKMIQSRRNIGITVAVLGLLLTCCLCPLALNSLAILGGGPGFYGRLFAARAGRLVASSYVIGAQNVCAALLALIVLIMGIVVLVQSRGHDQSG
jgi:hypothetical protein